MPAGPDRAGGAVTALVETDIADLLPERQRDLVTDCRLVCAERVIPLISFTLPTPGRRQGCRIRIGAPDFTGRLQVAMGPGGGRVEIDSAGPITADLRLWRNPQLKIGRGTTISSARFVCDHADVEIGEDGLWSDEILVQSNDQHGIIDLASMAVTNGHRRSVTIGAHVWIGRRAILMPDTRLGRGSILATGAVLTADAPEFSVLAGIPARVVRTGTSWSRGTQGMSAEEKRLLGLPGRAEGI